MRAAHTRVDPNPLINDPWGDRLVPESARDMFRKAALAGMNADALRGALASPDTIIDESLRRSRAYANVITRTRFAEDALQLAVTQGIRQYVLIARASTVSRCAARPLPREPVSFAAGGSAYATRRWLASSVTLCRMIRSCPVLRRIR
jgi:hypothetical protein